MYAMIPGPVSTANNILYRSHLYFTPFDPFNPTGYFKYIPPSLQSLLTDKQLPFNIQRGNLSAYISLAVFIPPEALTISREYILLSKPCMEMNKVQKKVSGGQRTHSCVVIYIFFFSCPLASQPPDQGCRTKNCLDPEFFPPTIVRRSAYVTNFFKMRLKTINATF